MAIVVKLITDYAPWLYAACGLVALWYLRVAIIARRERRQAAFTLEREAALNRTYQAFAAALVLLVVMGLVYFTTTWIATAVEPLVVAVVSPTPTALVLPTATPTAEPVTATPSPTPLATKAPTPRPTPTATTAVTRAPVVVAPSCPDGRARLVQPGVNQPVSGNVQVIGTAATDQFAYYKLEFKPAGAPGEPTFILSRTQPVIDGPLGTWNVGGLPAGAYILYLRTVDATGNFGECAVQVQVSS
jgi:hypothetical protein